MKTKTNKNEIKIELKGKNQICNTYYVARVTRDKDRILSYGNEAKIADFIAGKTIVLNCTAWRLKAEHNPHIAKEIREAGLDGTRLYGGTSIFDTQSSITRTDDAREYLINLDTLESEYLLHRNERVCKSCGRLMHKTDIIGRYCAYCLQNANSNSICLARRYSYHGYDGGYTIYEDIDDTKTFVFGAEIERDYLGSYNTFDDNLREALIGSCKTLYNLKKPCKRQHVFMRDGSLCEDGIEWITYPATYKFYKHNAKKIDDTLKLMSSCEFDASDRAGNHIHINRSVFDKGSCNKDASRFAATKIALLLAENWREFCAIAGRDINNTGYTTKPPQTKSDNMFTLARKTIENECSHSTAVNLQHPKTIELRIFGSVHSAAELLLYLDIAQALAEFAKRKSIEKTQTAKVADVCKYLTDKKEHLTEIAKRLHAKNSEQAADIDALLQKLNKTEV